MGSNQDKVGFHCQTCGEYHEGFPKDIGYDYPDYWFEVPEDERTAACAWTPDWCAIRDSGFFIRGVIEIPIQDGPGSFGWGVWVSLSGKNFARALSLREEDDVVAELPYFGWLSNEISIYPPTLNLKTKVHLRPGNLRPTIELEPTDHPLAVEQREGITMTRVQEIVEPVLHHKDNKEEVTDGKADN